MMQIRCGGSKQASVKETLEPDTPIPRGLFIARGSSANCFGRGGFSMRKYGILRKRARPARASEIKNFTARAFVFQKKILYASAGPRCVWIIDLSLVLSPYFRDIEFYRLVVDFFILVVVL